MGTVDFFPENLIVSRGGDNGNIEIPAGNKIDCLSRKTMLCQ